MKNTSGILVKIKELKKKRNAVILVHNYQIPEVQDAADFLGDSLALSRRAAETEADVIVFCGVHFMAETAAILSPEKTVLIPDESAGCPMADMIDAAGIRALRKAHPGAAVVCYVNTTAAVKAESDICCTSANAVEVVNSLEAEEIIFVPDRCLGGYTASFTTKKVILYDGYCPVHQKITAGALESARKKHPRAFAIVHPECPPETLAHADAVASTSGMIDLSRGKKEVLAGTETGMLYSLSTAVPGVKFYPVTEEAVCRNMKKINLVKLLDSLEKLRYEVKVDKSIAARAGKALSRMLEVR
ncbi:MAG: quinolinate synthase NadA [bacterium]